MSRGGLLGRHEPGSRAGAGDVKLSALGPTGPERRTQLTRERVMAAAIELADRDGIESISMRKLAQELGVEAMSLYTHVRNKNDLLDGMADTVISQIPVSAGGTDWKASLRQLALAARSVMLRHPWAPRTVEAQRRARARRAALHQRGARHPPRRRLLDRADAPRPAHPRQPPARVHPGRSSTIPATSSRRPPPPSPAHSAPAIPTSWRWPSRSPTAAPSAVRRRRRVRVRARLHPRRPRPAPERLTGSGRPPKRHAAP